jgi:hypothetical protein
LIGEEHEVKRCYLRLRSGYHIPERIGYLVGVRAVQELRRTHGRPELARWSTDRAMTQLRRVLQEQT